ncbi:uncharacterized protein LOC126567380 [Anopheles maculipalpis]|uniref:uncharacterized protein LOC126567380 n=1 Tax=Anopheles maculipalpis TaxID=1496333 RepID=UPI002159042D|nr:uncharacterized protein LOC126567380 [Anopheles maculipalpis]
MANPLTAVVATKDCQAVHSFLLHTEKLMVSLPFHTNPVFNLCTSEKANEEYRNATLYYRNMTNAPECQIYFGHNRMNVYETIYNQLTGLWNSANCDACISAVNETAAFMNLSSTLDACLQSSKTPCESCDTDYQNVQQLYAQMDKRMHGPDQMCFDIADRMNQTRRAWSGQYNCCNDKRRSMVIFASVASVACVIPFVFYALMHLITVHRERRRISLLSATSVQDESAVASCSSRTNNGVLRHPDMERIMEADCSEENDGEEEEKEEHIPKSDVNNLDVKQSNLIDISEVDNSLSVDAEGAGFKNNGNLLTDDSDDSSLLL